jgi:hypothetical protein
VIFCVHALVQHFQNALAYFAMVVSYECKMFMKLTPDRRLKTLWGRRLVLPRVNVKKMLDYTE